MKTQDKDEEVQGLGAVIKKPEPPRHHKKVREGVYQGPDGKFYTNISPPPLPTIWELYGVIPATGAKP